MQNTNLCLRQGVGTADMNAGDEPVIGITSTYQEPGIYTLEVGQAKSPTDPAFPLWQLGLPYC